MERVTADQLFVGEWYDDNNGGILELVKVTSITCHYKPIRVEQNVWHMDTDGTIGFLKEMCPSQIIDKSTITL